MSVKKTRLLVAEVRMIASVTENDLWRNILEEAAERLEDTETIAEFYRKVAETEGAMAFAKFLIDKCKGGSISICDLPDLVCDFEDGGARLP